MNFIFDNDRPIYIQLVEQLKEYIVSGKFKAGEKLPSVREFAMQIPLRFIRRIFSFCLPCCRGPALKGFSFLNGCFQV